MKTLSYGALGPQVALLQLALVRAGFSPGKTDGMFGSATRRAVIRFQQSVGLAADGIVGPLTHAALHPYYTGYLRYVLRPGDSFYRIARRFGSSVAAISAANPELDPLRLPAGETITVPLPFEVVSASIPYYSETVSLFCEGLAARYPFLSWFSIGTSVMGSPLEALTLGTGVHRVLYQAEHHANEWITTPLLLKFSEELATARAFGKTIFGRSAEALLTQSTLTVIPAVNPDGMDLVTGALTDGRDFDRAERIATDYPSIPFPEGWKANIAGTDLNLQYPANWEEAKRIKYAQGYVSPAPRDYVGEAPLSAPESLALYEYTRIFSPALTLSYHTQGQVIYWKYLDFDPPGAAALAQRFSEVSGYPAETTPYASGFAGYKDWFIRSFDRPGFTVEAGLGENPLPLRQFPQIYTDNLGILALGLETFTA